MNVIFQQLVKDHHKYYQSSIKTRRFLYEDMIGFIKNLKNKKGFQVENVGKSFLGKEIFCVHWGNGPINILMWSQMHGDESTATRAGLDIFNFLGSENDDYDLLRKVLSEKITLHFIPVLNPDGTNHWQRRTLQDIDMNRDAVRLQTPEARILKSLCNRIKPMFGFNLHDQSKYYAVGDTNKPATISFLAPTYNHQKETNDIRKRSIQLISYLNQQIQAILPGYVGKYDDTFNPRAFGDNIMKWGVSVILIESGGYPDDPEKEYIRTLNFAMILDALGAISEERYTKSGVEEYDKIPFNKKEHFFDLVIRNSVIKRNDLEYKVDIAINYEEVDLKSHRDFYYRGKIVDIGDLSLFHGYEEYDLNGMEIEPGKTFPYHFESHAEAMKFDMKKVLKNGYTSIVIEDAALNELFTRLPVNIILKEEKDESSIGLDQYANFVAREEGEVKLTVVNGFIFKSGNDNLGIKNGLVLN